MKTEQQKQKQMWRTNRNRNCVEQYTVVHQTMKSITYLATNATTRIQEDIVSKWHSWHPTKVEAVSHLAMQMHEQAEDAMFALKQTMEGLIQLINGNQKEL